MIVVFDDRLERLLELLFVERLDSLAREVVVDGFHKPVIEFRRLGVGIGGRHVRVSGKRIELPVECFDFCLSEFL